MNRCNWSKQPNSKVIPQVCHCGVLPLTLKTFDKLVGKFNKNSKLKWHQVEFHFVSVVARVLQLEPLLVITDNTAIISCQSPKDIPSQDLLLKTKYYRFIFQATPYSSTARIVRAQLVTPKEITAHLMNLVTEKLFAKSHEKFINKAQEKEDKEANSVALVRRAAHELKHFKIEDLHQSVALDRKLVDSALEILCNMGEIGDMGNYFIAVKKDNEQIQ